MHWLTIDGYRLPKPCGGHPAVDFCNTRAGWGARPHPRQEWLKDYDRFAVWARHVGLLDHSATELIRGAARRDPGEGSAVLAQATRFRAALYPTLLRPADAADFQQVAELARRAASAAVLVEDEPGGTARWTLPHSLGPELPLLAVAGAAAELLCRPERRLVRACPGDGCGWLFLDRRGRRRWCSMSDCGNRAKVRMHAARRRART
ncbi:MAG: CGNR zinc finger domain-containing protein [Carbonactinosporaceae bacterium]